MRPDEKDLEKAGPRASSKSRKYNQFFRRILLKNRKSTVISTLSLICITLFLMNAIANRTASNFLTSKASSANTLSTSPGAQFKDASQLTDYKLLNKLLTDKHRKKTTSSGSNNRKPIHLSNTMTMDTFNNPWHQIVTQTHTKNSFTHLLSKGLVQGHTFDELRRLTNGISLASIFYSDVTSSTHSSSVEKRSGEVPVTAIVHTHTMTQLYAQVQSILTQTALPQHIWIVCSAAQKQEVEARILTLDRRRVSVLTTTSASTTNPNDWLTLILPHVATEFVWVIDQDIAPGKRYLEKILKLSFTQHYQSSLLSTEAANVDRNTGEIECIPDSVHATDSQMKSQMVDMINDSWLLHRSWIPHLLDSSAPTATVPKQLPMGVWISQTLYKAGIPSIAIPIDPIERAYWGDVRLSKTQKSQTCISLKRKDTKQSLLKYYQSEYHYHPTAAIDSAGTSSQGNTILLYMDTQTDMDALQPLLCKFSDENIDVHIVTRYISDMASTSAPLCSEGTNRNNIFIHDLNGNEAVAGDILYPLTRIFTITQPTLIIHSVGKENSPRIHKQLQTVSNMFNCTSIYLPKKEIIYALWLPDLPLSTLSKWNDIHIKLMVTVTDKKTSGLETLLDSVDLAHSLGDDVDITLFLDYSSDKMVKQLVDQYSWKNKKHHIKKQVRHRIAASSKSSIFVESWYPSNNDEYAIMLNNELELSKFYYIWAKYTILRYRYATTSPNHHLFGISLYSPEILETDQSGRKVFDAAINNNNNSTEPYLMQWPSYLGAIYFPEHWREFHDYITARLADQQGYKLQDIAVPNVRSAEWNYRSTWRRFFEELIYLRPYVMLYPPSGASLSTAHIELRKKSLKKDFENAISLYNVPLLTTQRQWENVVAAQRATSMDDMTLFDLWGQPATMQMLKERGLDLHLQVSACTPSDLSLFETAEHGQQGEFEEETEPTFDPSDILCPFSKVVSVTLDDENDTVPDELPVKEVKVFT